MTSKVLHILVLENKFTLPLLQWLLEDEVFYDHKFLIISKRLPSEFIGNEKIIFLKTPIRYSLIKMGFAFIRELHRAETIVLHGTPIHKLFFLMPWLKRKISWIIHGHDLYKYKQNKVPLVSKSVLGKVSRHITHIEGDSQMANQIFDSNSVHHYSPAYLSNVISVDNFSEEHPENGKYVVLLGNSLSRSNNHLELLSRLSEHRDSVSKVICPLSYGKDNGYREKVISKGKRLFGERFTALVEFLPLKEYQEVITEVDVALFDHWRQEAMGITLLLLSLGKTVYMRSDTTSYKSLSKRGFKVYDNTILFNNGPLPRSIDSNKFLLEKYYSFDTLRQSYIDLKQ